MLNKTDYVKGNNRRDQEILLALEIAAAWINEAKLSNNPTELEQASESFLRLAEISCAQGLETEVLSIAQNQTLDGPTLKQIVQAVRRPREPHLSIVK